MEKIGQRLSEARKKAGKSQGEVSAAIKKSRQMVSNYESDLNEPGLDELRVMAKLYGCTVGYLIGETEDVPAAQSIENHPAYIALKNEVVELRITLQNVLKMLGGNLGKSEAATCKQQTVPAFLLVRGNSLGNGPVRQARN